MKTKTGNLRDRYFDLFVSLLFSPSRANVITMRRCPHRRVVPHSLQLRDENRPPLCVPCRNRRDDEGPAEASVYVPTVKATVLSRRLSLADASWTSDDNEVNLLTQLIKPVVA